MTQLMLDIETLSIRSNAAVTSIGYAFFDQPRGVFANGLYSLRSEDWVGDIDPGTIKWWMLQSSNAKQATFDGMHVAKVVALELRGLIMEHKPQAVWASDPSFDIVILKNWWDRFITGLPFPVSYKIERSCRTIFDLAKRYHIDYSEAWSGATLHDAMSDATCQARAVQFVQNELDRRMGYQQEG